MKKRILSILLTIALVLGMGVLPGFAEGDVKTAKPFPEATYELMYYENEDGICICGSSGDEKGELVIPAEIDGKKVTGISGGAFFRNSRFSSVTIPKTIKAIGYRAFLDCFGLKSVKISDLEAWCNISFEPEGANPLESAHDLYLNGKLLTKLVLPEDITELKDYCFSGCTSITGHIAIPASLKKIGAGAFSGCTGLTGVEISDLAAWCDTDFTYYGSNPLESAHNLYLNGKLVTELELPKDLTSVKYRAFSGASCLKGDLVIPDGVKEINLYAFEGCKNLTGVTIPASVKLIDSYAFEDCIGLEGVKISDLAAWCNIDFGEESNPLMYAHNLYLNGKLVTELVLPKELTEVKNETFSGAKCLEGNLVIPASVTKISEGAFKGCKNLTGVTIPATMKEISIGAFQSCTGLRRVDISDLAAWCNTSFGPVGGNPLESAHNLYLNGKLITKLVLPENLTAVRPYTFSGATCFEGKLVIPDGMENINEGAFKGCKNLTGIVDIPASVKKLGRDAFLGCSGLTGINISDIDAWCNLNFYNEKDNPLTRIHNLYLNGKPVTDLVIPEGVREIGKYAFSGCTGIRSLTLPGGIEKIGDSAFQYCSQLKKINVSLLNDLLSIKFGEFHYPHMFNDYDLYVDGKLVTDLVIPEGTTEIGKYTFAGCTSIKSLTLPKTLKSIDYNAFEDCTGLTGDLVLPEGMTYLGENAFSGCSGFETVKIPDSLDLSFRDFTNCGGKKFVVDEASKKYRADGPLLIKYEDDCVDLISCLTGASGTIDVPEDVIRIYCAFIGCSDVTEVNLSAKVQEVGYGSFDSSGVQTINVAKDNPVYLSHDGILYEKDENGSLKLYRCPPCRTKPVTAFADNVDCVGDWAFRDCKGIGTSLSLPAAIDILGGFILEDSSIRELTINCPYPLNRFYYNPPLGGFDGVVYRPTSWPEDMSSVWYGDFAAWLYIGEKSHADEAFIDVPAGAWYCDNVNWAYTHRLFGGTSENTFEPESPMTRAMLVTVLWRYAGKEEAGRNTFTDVPEDMWYTQAVAWAAEKDIVGGIGGGKFDPEGNITREQMAAILYRYNNYISFDTVFAEGDLSVFPDCGDVSSWAEEPLSWAVDQGIINGSEGKLLPQGNATRAQVAAILMRFAGGNKSLDR